MVRRSGSFAAFVVAVLCSEGCAQDAAAAPRADPSVRELRGAWVATVDNIDWPSRPGLPVAKQKEELDAILDQAAAMRLNALFFQVRPACDALYRSELEPWSEWLSGAQGRAPDPAWDPLQHVIDGAHARAMELHAWINPFRARHRAATSPVVDRHRAKAWMVKYGEELWLDPSQQGAREHTLAVALDIVRRYDVDGIHMDDYFYPYPVKGQSFPDDASYADYVRGGGKLDRGDWRRMHVDAMVESLHRGIRQVKPKVRFGISPFGILRPGVPKGIEAGIDQYKDLYADVGHWVKQRWCDYVAPQLYWPVGQRAQSYATLLEYWDQALPDRMHLLIGNYTTKAARAEKGWSVDELLDQIDRTRARPRAVGNIHFSMKVLRDDIGGVRTRLRAGSYQLPALPPAWPWLDGAPPAAPQIRGAHVDGDVEVRWNADQDARLRALYLACGDRWVLIEVVSARKPGILVTAAQLEKLGVRGLAVSSVDECGNESERVVKMF
ncbi:MAG: family 10 glycosylhydrolase [Planctomycetes bacterium]|nr:family 10 glycosylhydrolase [Planctomycetota bacterium]